MNNEQSLETVIIHYSFYIVHSHKWPYTLINGKGTGYFFGKTVVLLLTGK